jgi:hypothetical protein
VIQEAYVGGISTRSVDDLVRAMGLDGVSKSQVSRLCAEIDERVGDFLGRPIEGDWSYVWLDATYTASMPAVAAALAACRAGDLGGRVHPARHPPRARPPRPHGGAVVGRFEQRRRARRDRPVAVPFYAIEIDGRPVVVFPAQDRTPPTRATCGRGRHWTPTRS